jgi:hypothetical protein
MLLNQETTYKTMNIEITTEKTIAEYDAHLILSLWVNIMNDTHIMYGYDYLIISMIIFYFYIKPIIILQKELILDTSYVKSFSDQEFYEWLVSDTCWNDYSHEN